MKAKYTKELLIEAIGNSISIRQALLYLGLSAQGGNYRVIHKAVKLYNIDISHFKGQKWARNKKIGPKRNLEDYLSNKFPINSFSLKRRLLFENKFEYRCSSCYQEKWLDQPIPLELDHIDGNSSNNNLTNLRLLCPNCHALTDTYRGRNKKSTKLSSG